MRFQREAEVLALLNHPNIAQIYCLEKSNDVTALVMELVEGPTLADRIVHGAIPLPDALPIAKQIAEALEAAHDTAGYMAPEQAKGRPADRRADMWAFGCVLYEMLTGRRTFAGEDVTEVLAAVMRDEPDYSALPKATPPTIETLIRR